jgi:predicted nucleotidyltransferase
MITGKQILLFEAFTKQPFANYARKDIKAYAKEKSNNALSLFIERMKKENILIESRIGRTGVLSLNMENDLTYHYMALCNSRRIPEPAGLSLDILQKELLEITPFYSTALFGSYAVGEQRKDSDVDIAVFIDERSIRKKMEAAANSAKLRSTIEIDVHVIPREEMIQMLTAREENLGKQIARKHIATHNPRIFYEIIKEGVRRGFRAQDLS